MPENSIESIMDAQNNNKEALSKLVEENSGLVWSIVKRFSGRGFELEDLYQIGVIGLIKSIKKFDPSFGVKLSTYAVTYILGEIKRFIRDDGIVKISRSIKELSIRIKEIEKRKNINGEDINVEELAKELNVDKEDIILAMDSMNQVSSIDEENMENGKSISIIDKLSNKKDESEMIVNKLTIRELIKDLDDREKEIILLRYYKQKTQMQVAKILNISQVQVSRIEKKILNNMKFRLTS